MTGAFLRQHKISEITGTLSTVNSTVSNLLAGGVFTGEWEEIKDYAIIKVGIYSDQDSASGGLCFQQSPDQSEVFDEPYDFLANGKKLWTPNPVMRYFRIVYTNGATPTTNFGIQTIYSSVYSKPTSHRLGDDVVDDDDTELVKAVVAYRNDNDGVYNNVSMQNPFPVDGDSVYAKDIWQTESDICDFSGAVTDLFDNLHTVIIDSTSNNPKEILIHFNRTVVGNVLGIGAFSGNFSNTEIQLGNSGGIFTTVVDESADNTDYTTRTFQLPVTAGYNAIKLRFHTTDTVTLSNLVILKTRSVVSRLQGVEPGGTVIDVQATADGSLKVSNENQFYRPIALRMNKVVQENLTLASDAVVDSSTITMTAGHGLVATDYIILLEENGEPQFFFAQILNVAVNVLTLDTLVPYPFSSADASITQYDPDLNKDGSVTVYKAELRNPFTFPIDITRLLFHMTDTTAMDDSKFAGGTALTNGIAFRKNISANNNVHYWNIKDNGGFGEIAFDKAYDDKAPAGLYGLSVRLTYAGQDKHGVAIRLEQGQAIELLIQDDLTGLSSFTITAEGHFSE